MPHRHSLLAGLCLALLAAAPAFAAAPASLTVEEWNKPDGSQGITLSTDRIKAGKVTITVKNNSTDEVHELLFVRTAMAPDTIPTEADNPAKVDEAQLKDLSEIGDVAPGKSISKTVSLKPGTYMLFCNQPGHFMAGMHSMLTVTQ